MKQIRAVMGKGGWEICLINQQLVEREEVQETLRDKQLFQMQYLSLNGKKRRLVAKDTQHSRKIYIKKICLIT